MRDYDIEFLRRSLIFKSLKNAEESLKGMEGIKDVKIETKPAFYKYMPFFPSRIMILSKVLPHSAY